MCCFRFHPVLEGAKSYRVALSLKGFMSYYGAYFVPFGPCTQVLVARGVRYAASHRRHGQHRRPRRHKHKKSNAEQEKSDKSDACERGHEIIKEAKKSPVTANHSSVKQNGSAFYNVFFGTEGQRARLDRSTSAVSVDDAASSTSGKTEEPNGAHGENPQVEASPRHADHVHKHRHHHLRKPVGMRIEKDSDYLSSKIASAYTGAFVLPHLLTYNKETAKKDTAKHNHHYHHRHQRAVVASSSNQTDSATGTSPSSVAGQHNRPSYKIDASKYLARPEHARRNEMNTSFSSRLNRRTGWLDIPEYYPAQYLTPSTTPVDAHHFGETSQFSDGYRSLDYRTAAKGTRREQKSSSFIPATVVERASVSPLASKRNPDVQNDKHHGKYTSRSAEDISYSRRYNRLGRQHSPEAQYDHFSRVSGGPSLVRPPGAYGAAFMTDPTKSYVERDLASTQTDQVKQSTRLHERGAVYPHRNSHRLSRSELEPTFINSPLVQRHPSKNEKSPVPNDDRSDTVEFSETRFLGSLSPAGKMRRHSQDIRRSLMERDFEEASLEAKSDVWGHDGTVPLKYGHGKRRIGGNRIRGGVETGVSLGRGPAPHVGRNVGGESVANRQDRTAKAIRRLSPYEKVGMYTEQSMANAQRQAPSPKPPSLPPRHGPEAEEASTESRQRASQEFRRELTPTELEKKYQNGAEYTKDSNSDQRMNDTDGIRQSEPASVSESNRVSEGSTRTGEGEEEDEDVQPTFITNGMKYSSNIHETGHFSPFVEERQSDLFAQTYRAEETSDGDFSGLSPSALSQSASVPNSTSKVPNIGGNHALDDNSPNLDYNHIRQSLEHRVRKSG